MSYVADLHIHSRFARACSPQLTIPNLAEYAKLKGVDLLGTGDFLHPLWLMEIKNNLKEVGNGIYEYGGVKFVLSCEVSLIYSHGGKVRRLHLIILLPKLASVDALVSQLAKRDAKLSSDGRPTIGMSAQDFLKLVLAIDEKAIIIPAHAWTPWFGLFGSASGYDSLEECFGDLTDFIYAVETGQSSDPAMNWQVGQLDQKTIVSFSDPHSLPKMGREATIFAGQLSYDGLLNDLKADNLEATIEFYPEEGRYHFDGHRNCGYSQSPDQTRRLGILCPKCGRRLNLGVKYQVDKLATRGEDQLGLADQEGWVISRTFPNRPKYRMLVPLLEIIAETFGVGVSSKSVVNEYKKLTGSLGKELTILTQAKLADIERLSGEKLAQAVDKVRKGDLKIEPGYDGLYGVVKIWEENELEQPSAPQMSLFGE